MLFDGDTVRIKAVVTDFDGQAVTNADVTSAVVNLYDDAGNYVFTNQPLTWSDHYQYWYHDWQDCLPGTFTAQCIFGGPAFEVFDYGLIIVQPLRVTPTGNPTPIVN